ncbi:hypothetical protein Tco_0247281 [Tanacetum coccineum]
MKSIKNVTEKEAVEYEKEKEELRANRSSSYHRDMQAFLRRLDRKNLNDLYKLVQERFQDHPLEGHDLLLWGELRMLFDPDEKDELWMNQLDWKFLKWKLHENCEVHTLFMDELALEAEKESTRHLSYIKVHQSMLRVTTSGKDEKILSFNVNVKQDAQDFPSDNATDAYITKIFNKMKLSSTSASPSNELTNRSTSKQFFKLENMKRIVDPLPAGAR